MKTSVLDQIMQLRMLLRTLGSAGATTTPSKIAAAVGWTDHPDILFELTWRLEKTFFRRNERSPWRVIRNGKDKPYNWAGRHKADPWPQYLSIEALRRWADDAEELTTESEA